PESALAAHAVRNRARARPAHAPPRAHARTAPPAEPDHPGARAAHARSAPDPATHRPSSHPPAAPQQAPGSRNDGASASNLSGERVFQTPAAADDPDAVIRAR